MIPGKVNLKTKSDASDKEGHFILIRGSMHQEDTIAIKVCVPNKSFKIHGVKTDRTKESDRQIHSHQLETLNLSLSS